jgi:hypothetical protein
MQFSGSQGNTIRLEVLTSGSVAFLGKSGSLFSISDNFSGSLMAVGDISGLPILEVFSDDRVVMGRFNSNALVVTGSNVGIGKSNPNPAVRLDVSGSVFISGSTSITGSLTVSVPVGTAAAFTSGNVGIGKTTPSVPLDINGNTFITGSLFVTGSISDFIGNVRDIPQNLQTSGYTLVASDNGKHIFTTASITVPASVFVTGDVVTVINSGSATLSITQGSSVLLRQAGTTNTGSRTLASHGIASITCVASNTFYVTGTGLV